MPAWLEREIMLSFQLKNLDNLKGYQKLWEDVQDEQSKRGSYPKNSFNTWY
jgi:hypothetical protein